MKRLKLGDWVVYRMQRHSAVLGPRTKEVAAAPRGDSFSYVVDKYRVVNNGIDDDQLLLITRTGKQHTVSLADPNLRAAGWWETLDVQRAISYSGEAGEGLRQNGYQDIALRSPALSMVGPIAVGPTGQLDQLLCKLASTQIAKMARWIFGGSDGHNSMTRWSVLSADARQ